MDWEENSLDILVDNFNKHLSTILDEVATECSKTVTQRMKVPWFTEEVRMLKHKLWRREKIWRKYGSHEHWLAYTDTRAEYRKLLKSEKSIIISNKVIQYGKDLKQLYSLVNNLLGTKAENPMPENQTDLELANEFSELFSSKIEKISEYLDHYPLYILEERNVPKLRKFRAMYPEEVMQIVMSMPPKHCALDPIPAQIFKKLVPYLLTELTVIVNKSLTEGKFATSWKTSVTKPLIKSTKLERVRQSYRPVGNLVFISKIVEQCMLTQFNEHCGLNQLMPNYQSAYWRFHSCETSLINLVNTILWNMESQKVMSCLIMDLSAAFDTVSFQIMEDVLEKEFGVTDAALKWYHNYLSPRQVMVNVNGTYSLPRLLTCRVVQGSASGPVAYPVYASTLKYMVQDTDQDCDSENVSEFNLNGFADDHSLNINFNPNEEGAELNTKHRMESKMCDINTWMNGNRLKMNSSKTEFI